MITGILVIAQISISIGNTPDHADSIKHERQLAHFDSLAAHRDSVRATRDSARELRRKKAQIAITPALLGSAFRDPAARELLQRARVARITQDSTLRAYDATTYERMSVGTSIGTFGRDRLLFRHERSTRVQWQRGKGAVVDITGERAALPMFKGAGATDVNVGESTVPIPYYPGREALWIGSGLAKADVNASEIIHPLANGAEAYYTYASGDSVAFQLPGGGRILVRELRVQPRVTRWNVVVGSLWFDTASGQLVRGVFRMAEPMDMMQVAKEEDGEDPKDDIPGWIKPMILPMTGSVDVITVDYGLFEGRYWLPRMQTVEGKARAGVMRFPFDLNQRFDYADVNGSIDLPPLQVTLADTAHDVTSRKARREARAEACRSGTGTREMRRAMHENAIDVLVRVPCDTAMLARSPTLPKSIYDRPDTLFSDAEMDALVSSALSLGRQAGLSPKPVTIQYGLPYTRYNRIEGISTAVEASKDLGSGYNARALARLGTDLSPDGEIGMSRSNGRVSYTGNIYRRLNSANDWGRNPFSLGTSLSALLFGHDDGVYYRSWGGELLREQKGGLVDTWRLFAEQEFDAKVRTRFSFAGKLSGGRFPNNIDVTNGSVVGLGLRKRGSIGEDPGGLRILSDVRIEGAAGSFDYARGMADVTLMRPLAGPLDGALTVSGGTSGGAVPTQRRWYLGGVSTVRGQDVGVAIGDAYWLTRLELGLGSVFAKPVIFGDLGWAGDRRNWTTGVMPVSGAGVGGSFMDGLIRLDLAKGIRPSGGVRASLYLDARF